MYVSTVTATAIMTAFILFCIFCVLILFWIAIDGLTYEPHNPSKKEMEAEINRLKFQNEFLNNSLKYYENQVRILRNNNAKSNIAKTNNTINTSKNIKEAVYYAMIKSHPDNGGKSEDFIKFKKLYDTMK